MCTLYNICLAPLNGGTGREVNIYTDTGSKDVDA